MSNVVYRAEDDKYRLEVFLIRVRKVQKLGQPMHYGM